MSIEGAFERLKKDNPRAAHHIYGKVIATIELCNKRNRKSDIVTDCEFVPDYNDEFFPEEECADCIVQPDD